MSEHGLKMWYSREAHGDKPRIVRTVEEMDAAIDDLLAQPFSSSAAVCYSLDRPLTSAGVPDHEFVIGVNAEDGVGSVSMMSDGNWFPMGTVSRYEEHFYCYWGEPRDFPRDAVLTLDQVRRAAREFLTSGGQRPTSLEWLEAPDPIAEPWEIAFKKVRR